MADENFSKIIISSNDRNISAIYVNDPANVDGFSGELFVNVGNGYYSVPEKILESKQSWRDLISPIPSNEDYFSHAFTEKGEIWNVCHYFRDDFENEREVVRLKIRYNGESGKDLFEVFYKLYSIDTVYIYDEDSEAGYPIGSDYGPTVKQFHFKSPNVDPAERMLENLFELEKITE